MPVIADEIQAALNHSPKHRDMLAAPIRHLEPWDVHAYATILGGKCRELGITDFPNPYKRVTLDADEGDKVTNAKIVHRDKRHVWATIFDACYLNVGLDPADPVYSITFQPPPPVDEPGGEIDMPDFEGMSKVDILSYIGGFYDVQLPKSWSHSKLVAAAEEIVLTAEEAGTTEQEEQAP